MTAALDMHSRLVVITKYTLLGIATILFIALFIIKKPDTIDDNSLLGTREIARLAFGESLQNPQFSGLTDDGDTIMVRADSAAPDAPRPTSLNLTNPRFSLDTQAGNLFIAESDQGFLKLSDQVGELTGDVRFVTSEGYQIKSDKLSLNLKLGQAESLGNVIATGPMGSIEAGSVRARRNDAKDSDKGAIIEFSEGVRLVFTPKE